MLTRVHALTLTHIAHTITPAHTTLHACTYTHAHIHTPTFAHGHTDTWAHTQGAHTDTYSLESSTCAYALRRTCARLSTCTCTYSCTPTSTLHNVLLHAHRHLHALKHMHTLMVCDRPAPAPPRPSHSKAQVCLLLSSPDLVTTAWCEPRPQLCHTIPLGYIRVLMLSAPPGPWVGSAGLPKVDWKCCGSPPAGWWVQPGGLLKG